MKLVVNSEYWYVYDKDANKNDPDSFNGGDYVGIILSVNGKPIKEYGDGYHDSSSDRIKGFIETLKSLGYEIEETFTSKMCSSRNPHTPICKKLFKLKDVINA